jgi:DNA gyrase/topoisomerase IV, subunit A
VFIVITALKRYVQNVQSVCMRNINQLIAAIMARHATYCCDRHTFEQVAQLAGYVSEHSAYHHGEVSLTGTIVNMAQTFCGSNNLALLTPGGQFGTLCTLC